MNRRVVVVKNDKVKVKDVDLWREFVQRLKNEMDPKLETFGGGACEEACRSHGGVDICGETFVICNDGEVWLLDP